MKNLDNHKIITTFDKYLTEKVMNNTKEKVEDILKMVYHNHLKPTYATSLVKNIIGNTLKTEFIKVVLDKVHSNEIDVESGLEHLNL